MCCAGKRRISRPRARCWRRRTRVWCKKVKPLYRLSEYETAAFAFLRGIDYIVEECPFSHDAIQLQYKEVLNQLEQRSPGTKQSFVLGVYARGAARRLRRRRRCISRSAPRAGIPPRATVCGFCRLQQEVQKAQPAEGNSLATDTRCVFTAGETAIMIERKQRLYLVTLQPGGKYSYHGGTIDFDDIIGQEEGVVLNSSHDRSLAVFRPSLAQYVLKMPRGAQVIYPKDLAAIVMAADIFPGAVVLESGTGSGALRWRCCVPSGSRGG